MGEVKEKHSIISLPNINTLINYAIELSEKEKISGKEKRDFALKLIESAIAVLPDDTDALKLNKEFLLTSYHNGNIADIIELVVDASKGKLNINKKIVTNIFLKCLYSILTAINK
jgi:hypothetical protein